jgi:hypothetical protein
MACWRNLFAWKKQSSYDDQCWIELPGPGEWWSDELEFKDGEEHGFAFVEENGHREAYEMIYVEQEPASYELIFSF